MEIVLAVVVVNVDVAQTVSRCSNGFSGILADDKAMADVDQQVNVGMVDPPGKFNRCGGRAQLETRHVLDAESQPGRIRFAR